MRLRLAAPPVFCALLALPCAAASDASPSVSPADRLTSALVAMGEAHVGDPVLAAWLGQQGEIPPLTGEQLARLKTAGLSDTILLQLVRGGAPVVAEAPVAEAVAEAVSEAAAPAAPAALPGGARLRVVVQSVPAVDYCELVLDGNQVASRGRLLEGVLAAGNRPPRTESLGLRTPTVLFEGNVPPGRHHVRTGFTVSRLQEEFADVRQGRRQRLIAEGVRAMEDDPGTACTVAPGELCLITARFRKVDRSLLAGRASYAVSYDTVVLSEADANVQAAWASPGP